MKMNTQQITVLVSKVGLAETRVGEIQVVFWNESQRMIRALQYGLAAWLGAAASIFLPLLHFVLVPVLLIAGPVLAFYIFKQDSAVLGGTATCPQCNAQLPITRSKFRFPISDLCTACQSALTIEKATQIHSNDR